MDSVVGFDSSTSGSDLAGLPAQISRLFFADKKIPWQIHLVSNLFVSRKVGISQQKSERENGRYSIKNFVSGLYTSQRKTSQGIVKKICRYNGQLVQVQWTFDQNHEIVLSTVLAFDCIRTPTLAQGD